MELWMSLILFIHLMILLELVHWVHWMGYWYIWQRDLLILLLGLLYKQICKCQATQMLCLVSLLTLHTKVYFYKEDKDFSLLCINSIVEIHIKFTGQYFGKEKPRSVLTFWFSVIT